MQPVARLQFIRARQEDRPWEYLLLRYMGLGCQSLRGDKRKTDTKEILEGNSLLLIGSNANTQGLELESYPNAPANS
jgi:hypothetical protein